MDRVISDALEAGKLTPRRISIPKLYELTRDSLEARERYREPRARDLENTVRHELTNYDAIRYELGLKPTTTSSVRETAYERLREVVDEEVARVYPELAEMAAREIEWACW